MKTKTLILSLLAAALSSACSLTASMLPIEGPLSRARPVPMLQVKVKGIAGNSGEVSFGMPDGEACAGRWSSASGGAYASGSGLFAQYGAKVLSGYSYTANTGRNPGQALVTCGGGRTFQLEFMTGAGTAHGYGIGKDNQDNLYRLVF